MLTQMILFREHAALATWLYAKKMFQISSLSDEKKMANICKALSRYECVLQISKHWVDKEPGNLEALSSLAVSLTTLNRFDESMPFFRAYFANGGHAFEPTRWYAATLSQLGEVDQAIPLYYQALAAEPKNRELSAELLSCLQKANRETEALSLREQLADVRHLTASMSKGAMERDIANEKIHDRNELHIPSMDGKTFPLPLTLPNNRIVFVSAEPDQKQSKISLDDLKEWELKFTRVDNDHVRIARLQAGAVIWRDIVVLTCNDCISILATDVLIKADGRVDSRSKIAMLILSTENEY